MSSAPTAYHIAIAIAAASKETGANPEEVVQGFYDDGKVDYPNSRARVYAAFALELVFPAFYRPTIAKLVGVREPSRKAFFPSNVASMRNGTLRWFDTDKRDRVVAAIRTVDAGDAAAIPEDRPRPLPDAPSDLAAPKKAKTPPSAPGRPDKRSAPDVGAIEPDEDDRRAGALLAPADEPTPPPYRPPPLALQKPQAPKQAPGTLERTGYRPPPGTVERVLGASRALPRPDRLLSQDTEQRLGRRATERESLAEILAEAARNTARMTPPRSPSDVDE